MTFYLMGIGLDKLSISANALEKLQECTEVFIESYTVNFPYPLRDLMEGLDIPLIEANRNMVENESILKNAKEKNVALLVYGDALSATTHMQLILACKKQNIPYKIFSNASIITAVAQTGLQSYKFGKITSMPNWKEHTNKPTSFTKYIKENREIGAHTLILTDIGLEIKDAINQLRESNIEMERILVLSNVGTTNQKIFYDTPDKIINKEIPMPFCLIIPGDLHFLEEEAIEQLKEN